MVLQTETIIKHLSEKERKEGLTQLLQFYLKLLRLHSEVEQKLASRLKPTPDKAAIRERLDRGTPLIGFDELAMDWPLLDSTFSQVAAIFAQYPGLFGKLPQELKAGANHFLTLGIVKVWFEASKPVTAAAVNEPLFSTLIQATIKPFLVSHAQTLRNSLEQEHWRRRYCPICGGSPDLSFLEKEVGARWLVCNRCDTEWLFQRLECPYCGTQEQNLLSYFSDDSGLYRLYVCEKCKRYLKAIDLRQAKSEVLLPLERLYTLDLDRQAKEQGYIARSGKF